MRMTSMQMSFPETGWLVSDDLETAYGREMNNNNNNKKTYNKIDNYFTNK